MKTKALQDYFEQSRQVSADIATAESEINKAARERQALIEAGDASDKAMQQAGGINLRASVFNDKLTVLNRKAEGLKVLMIGEIHKLREEIATAVVARRDATEDKIAERLAPFCEGDDDLPAKLAEQLRGQNIPYFRQLTKMFPTGDHFTRPNKSTVFDAVEVVLNHAAKVEAFLKS